jgi:hypothetical protein
MQQLVTSIGNTAIASARLAASERWLLGVVVAACLGSLLALGLLLQRHDLGAMLLADRAAALPATAPRFDVAAELASLDGDAGEPVDLAASADLAAADRFAPASGAPLNLLAQVDAPRRPPPSIQLALAVPVASGPVLTAEEQFIVDANAERREVLLALADLNERVSLNGVAVVLAVQPLLLRASAAAESLDAYGDALLLSEGMAERQLVYFGFQASRAAALADIRRAEAMLG